MLRSLEIRDILLIDRLALEFQPGLNVLTGETGAGKSILLDALGFVLGWRGRADLVRSGAQDGEVTAVFDLPTGHGARAVLADAGFDPGDELVLRRVNTVSGRKSAWVNDRRASGELLRALSDTLVELHGQHDDRGLLDARGHRRLLDAFAGVDVGPVRQTWGAWREARDALARAQDRAEALRADEDFLRHAVAELDALAPCPGEEAELDTARRQMQAAQRVREDVSKAHQACEGAEAMALDSARWLDGAAGGIDGLDTAIEAVARAIEAIGDAERAVAGATDALAFDPLALERCEERLFALRALARKHAVAPDDLAKHADTLRQRLDALERADGDLGDLAQAVSRAETAYHAAAQTVSDQRQQAGSALERAMTAELAPLKMERAVFSVATEPADPGPDGCDAVGFRVATNPGTPAGDLGKIASGGELSRFLLALKVCLTGTGSGRVMIFDEIDRGVGGATADAVGRRLAALADGGQVLVVTHSPQVAALGQHHWQVAKEQRAQVTLSRVTALAPDQRVDEIARMLSGDAITEAARAAARELISAG